MANNLLGSSKLVYLKLILKYKHLCLVHDFSIFQKGIISCKFTTQEDITVVTLVRFFPYMLGADMGEIKNLSQYALLNLAEQRNFFPLCSNLVLLQFKFLCS